VQHYREEQILETARLTGLSQLISSRPEGLDLRIPEGGEGVSGGQKQLIALTRVILSSPQAWLLDEPTASLDDMAESQVIQALKESVKPGQSLILVTHKMRLLELVDRLVIITPKGIAIDGPKDQVLARLQASNSHQGARA
jgi:ATP-binding cassette, subfamily C, bacterial LapB